MTLKDTLAADMKVSMQAGTFNRTSVIRLVMAAITNERIKLGHELSEDEALRVLQREAKQRQDSILAYREAGREELASEEAAELEIITAYLPQQLSEADVQAQIDAVISVLGSNAQSGQVTGAVMKTVGATADGATVARLVRERFSK